MTTTWLILLASAVVLVALLGVAGLLLFARRDAEDAVVAKRIARLSLRNKARLAVALSRDRRIPLAIRALPPALALYLAMPLDLVPDFIPVVGQLDDLLIVGLGVWLLFRFVPRPALLEHIDRLETEQDRARR